MTLRALRVSLLAAGFAAWPAIASAQFPPPPAPPGAPPPVQERWPQPARPAPAPAPQQQQSQQQPPAADPDAPAPAAKPRAPAAPGTAVTCGGVFGKDSTHLKLAMRYDSRNVAYTEVDGPDGTRLNASVLYPNDPKRRLEVLWNNEAGRSDTSLIAINGQSQWSAPRGLKLGMPLAALEKANGRPFKLKGFAADGSASVTGWEGGALSTLPGGCKVGVRLIPGRGVPDDARSAVTGDKDLLSNDPGLRAVKPTVAEILIGY